MSFSKARFFGLLILFMALAIPRAFSFPANYEDREANGGVLIQNEGEAPEVCHPEAHMVESLSENGAMLIERHDEKDGDVYLLAIFGGGPSGLLKFNHAAEGYCEAVGIPAQILFGILLEQKLGVNTYKITPLWKKD